MNALATTIDLHDQPSNRLPAYASVVVIGGGPAGGFTALELAQNGCDVLLLERQATSSWKIGETLPPEARIHLQRLGYWDRLQTQGHLPCPGIVSAWGEAEPIEKDFIFNPYGQGWQLDRARFEEELLLTAAAAGCQVARGANVFNIERQRGGWILLTDRGEVATQWVVDCSGRRAEFARRQEVAYEQLDDLVSVFAFANGSPGTDSDARTYVEAFPDGWCYSALTPNRARIIAFQTDRDYLAGEQVDVHWLRERLTSGSAIDSLLRQHAYELQGSVQVAPAHSGRFAACAGSGWVAVGDAAMTFDPLSGQGTCKSMESAYRAVRLILHGEDYASVCDRLWSKFLEERAEFYSAERRWPEQLFWSRRSSPVTPRAKAGLPTIES